MRGCFGGWGALFFTFCIGVLLTLVLPPVLVAALEAIMIMIMGVICFFRK